MLFAMIQMRRLLNLRRLSSGSEGEMLAYAYGTMLCDVDESQSLSSAEVPRCGPKENMMIRKPV